MRLIKMIVIFLGGLVFLGRGDWVEKVKATGYCDPNAAESTCDSSFDCDNHVGTETGNSPTYCTSVFTEFETCYEVVNTGLGNYFTLCYAKLNQPTIPVPACGTLHAVCCPGPDYCQDPLVPQSTNVGNCWCVNPLSPLPTTEPIPTPPPFAPPTAGPLGPANLPRYPAPAGGWGMLGDLNDLDVGGIVSNLLPYIYVLAGLGLLVMLIAGGIGLMTGGGDPGKTKASYGKIVNAVIGFLIVFISYFVVQLVEVILGVNIL